MPIQEPLLFDSHMHTPLCKHAVGHPRAYARQGRARGLAGVIFTCHSPMPDGFGASVRMDPGQFEYYVSLIEQTAEDFEGELTVLLGLESDFFPGMESWLEELHSRAEFHYILGSVHYHLREYHEVYFRGDIFEFQKQYFEHLAESAETGLFDALAHPDLIKNASPESYELERLLPAIGEALDRIAAAGTAMELNTSGLNKIYPEMNPGPVMLGMMQERGIPVVLGSDSHTPERVGADFGFALEILRDAGFEEVSIFRERRRRAVPISEILPTLRQTVMSSGNLLAP